MTTIDLQAFEEIRARYGSTVTLDRREKYLDLEYWIGIGVERVFRLGLDTGPRRRILDLGCGAGYFLYVCKLFGHDVLGLDVPEERSMYTEIRELLGIPWIAHEIKPMEPLPQMGRFDVVTAHMVCFNGHRTWQPGDAMPREPLIPWSAREWACLLDQVPGAVVHLELNAEQDGTLFPPGLREFFVARGATIVEHQVLIT